MLLLLVTGISLLFFIKSLFPRQIASWASDLRSFLLYFWEGFPFSPPSAVKRSLFGSIHFVPKFTMELRIQSKKIEILEDNSQASILGLPEQILECILERLTPAELCSLAGVCRSLREMCTSDHLWERQLEQKWGRILGPSAYNGWQCFMASRRNSGAPEGFQTQGLIKFIWRVWPFSQFGSEFEHTNIRQKSWLPVDSAMSWYLALETGKFWFPAQVYNREYGHVGFMLSCYDAELSYDSQTDTFQARYPPHGRRAVAIETGINWKRVRAPPVDTSPHELHISNCLNDLRPGDHIEIQWRRNQDFPYGWWYGVVGHLESCDRNENHCQCHNSDTVVLEFKQYNPGSRWRCATISREDHREECNEADGFYGGIRKLHSHDEIARWKALWP